MARFNLRTKELTLPDGMINADKIHFFPVYKEDHFAVIAHPLGISKKRGSDNIYKASKQSELKNFKCKSADFEFAFIKENITIIKLKNKIL